MPVYLSFLMIAAAGTAGMVLVLGIFFEEVLTGQDIGAEIAASWTAFVSRISSSWS